MEISIEASLARKHEALGPHPLVKRLYSVSLVRALRASLTGNENGPRAQWVNLPPVVA